jgi:hypothetical protein
VRSARAHTLPHRVDADDGDTDGVHVQVHPEDENGRKQPEWGWLPEAAALWMLEEEPPDARVAATPLDPKRPAHPAALIRAGRPARH